MKEKSKVAFKEKINIFKEKHEKGISVAKKIGLGVLVAVVGGAIGYNIAQGNAAMIAESTASATDATTDLIEDAADSVSDSIA